MTRNPDENGWQSSASSWIDRMHGPGDFARVHVLDDPMIDRVRMSGAETALDVGCGEGRFCRKMAWAGVRTTGIDPVPEMIAAASAQDGKGRYETGFAEDLPFDDASFDLVVSYLTLIDIDDAESAIQEMTRVARPGGRILIANLSSFSTAMAPGDKRYDPKTGQRLFPMRPYLDPVADWFEWDGLRVRNWHRPLSQYMGWFLAQGLTLTHFDEPAPVGTTPQAAAHYRTNPYLMMMEWQKPL